MAFSKVFILFWLTFQKNIGLLNIWKNYLNQVQVRQNQEIFNVYFRILSVVAVSDIQDVTASYGTFLDFVAFL